MKTRSTLTCLIFASFALGLPAQDSPSQIGKPMPEPGRAQQDMTPEERKQQQAEFVERTIDHIEFEMSKFLNEENALPFEDILRAHFNEESNLRETMRQTRNQSAAGPDTRQTGMEHFREQREAILESTIGEVKELLGKKASKKFKKVIEAMEPKGRQGGRGGGGRPGGGGGPPGGGGPGGPR